MSVTTMQLPVIGSKEQFYGYIVSLGVGLEREETIEDNAGCHIELHDDRRLYAMFEYNGHRQVWVVPDAELFRLLATHLYSMARTRDNTDDYGYDKLWISKETGAWKVDLP